MKSRILTASPLIAAIVWTVALMIDPGDFEPASVLAVGLGLLAMSTVSVVAMVIEGSRWARRLGFAVVGATALVAAMRPVDPMWVIALAFSAMALTSLFLPPVTDGIRKLPSASGPPPRAVAAPLLLLAVPVLAGIGSDGAPWATIAVAATALIASVAYARVIPGGLVGIRIIWPLIAVGLAPLLGLVGGGISATLGIVVAVLAWHPSVKVAYHPPTESGSAYPIPPELAPGEVLDAAQIDDRGRPR